MTTVPADELSRLPLPSVSRTRLVFADRRARGAVRDALSRRAVASSGRFRMAAIRFDRLPPLRELIDDALDQLATLALGLYPDWYGADARAAEFDAIPTERLDGAALPRRGVSAPWLKSARRLCRRAALPRPRGFPASVQAAQLALAVDPSPLLIALTVDDESPAEDALLGMSRASEWLAREAGARVVLIVADHLEGATALDGVAFGAVRVVAPKPGPAAGDGAATAAPRLAASPLIGRPNPASRGELMLAARLEADEELSGLFRFNVRVETPRGDSPLVDMVWESGKLVVEVDGYYYHSDERAFSRDRRRDYELMLGGFLVLRLPEDEVAADVELAVEKVRDLVALRKANRAGLPIGVNDAT